MKSSSALRWLAIAVALTVMLTDCSRDPNVRKQKYFASGQRYFQQGKYREAAIEFTNALQLDPQYAQAHYQLAGSYLKLQQWPAAYQELSRTLELQPENYQARIDLANLLIAAKQLKDAQEQTGVLLKQRPEDAEVHLVAANLLAAQENVPGAIQEAQKAVALDPKHAGSYLTLALLQARSAQPDAAEPNFVKAAELEPKAVDARLALGAYYQARSRYLEAEQQFRAAVAADPTNLAPRTALVRLYMAIGEKPQAEAVLLQAKRDFSDNSAGYRMLGDFYYATGDLGKAAAEYASLYYDHPSDSQVKKNYIQLLILQNRLDEARKLDDEILQGHANDADALIYRGQVQIRQGHAADAVNTLQAAVKSDPQSGLAHFQLGAALDQQGNAAQAAAEWHEAARLQPDLVEVQRALANLALRQGDMAALEQAAGQIVQLQPASAEGYVLRAVSFINRKQFAAAEADIHKAIEIAPQSAAGYVQLGNLELAQKKYDEAEKAYAEALGHDADSADALSGLMNAELAQKHVDQAIAAARAQIAKSPNNSAFSDLLGTALFNNKNDLGGAETALRKSLELDSTNSDALVKLGQVLKARGSVDEAIALYQHFLQENPRATNFYILTGELYETKQDWPHARQMYQKALDLSPDNALAANNLASVLLKQGGNLDAAMSLAQTARRGMPDSPDAADTLGWVYYQKGLYPSAIDLFEQALSLAGNNRNFDAVTTHYHLGLAYQKSGKNALARQQFEHVLSVDPNYADAGDVKKQLAQLRYARTNSTPSLVHADER